MLSIVKYALVGYMVVKSGQFIVRKISEWRGKHEA